MSRVIPQDPFGWVKKAERVLTNAEIIALPTTSIELLSSQGSDKATIPILVIYHLENWVADYTNITGTSILFVDNGAQTIVGELREDVNSSVSSLLAGGGPDGVYALSDIAQFATVTLTKAVSGYYESDIKNKALNIVLTNTGNLTGGNDKQFLRVTCFYILL